MPYFKQEKFAPSGYYFKTPFTPAYWRCAIRELREVKVLILAALFIALDIVISSLFIPVGENLRIYFSFFVKALGSMIYGPIVGLLTGFIGDTLGYLLRPDGPYFPGYALTSMTSGFLYGIFFYRARVSIPRVVINRVLVVLICNIGMNCLWSAMLYGKGYYYYLASSIVKNGLLFPVELAVLYFFLRGAEPLLERVGMRPRPGGPAGENAGKA